MREADADDPSLVSCPFTRSSTMRSRVTRLRPPSLPMPSLPCPKSPLYRLAERLGPLLLALLDAVESADRQQVRDLLDDLDGLAMPPSEGIPHGFNLVLEFRRQRPRPPLPFKSFAATIGGAAAEASGLLPTSDILAGSAGGDLSIALGHL
jgi:hypothetical protein